MFNDNTASRMPEEAVVYNDVDRTASMPIGNGITITADRINRRGDGNLSAVIDVISPAGSLGSAHVEFGDTRRRTDFIESLIGANEFLYHQWQEVFRAFYLGVEKEIRQVQERLVPEDSGFLDISVRDEPGVRQETVQSIIPRGKITSLYSIGGTGKTFLAMILVQCVILGLLFLDTLATISGDVLYLDFEDDEEEFTRRAYEVGRGLNQTAPPVGLFYRRLNRPLSDGFSEILHYVSEQKVSLVIVDSFGAACAGESEGSRDSIALMQLLQLLPCTVLLIDHEPKASTNRGPTQYGSVYKRNLSRSQLRLEDRGWDDAGRHALILKHMKLNSGPLHGGLPFYMCFEGSKVFAVRADASDEPFLDDYGIEGSIVEAIRTSGLTTANELAAYIQRPVGVVRNALTKLTRTGKVGSPEKRGKANLYQLTLPKDSSVTPGPSSSSSP